MEKIEVYEIDDQFDPLEDMGIDDDIDDEDQQHDYLAPIPDAELSVVPEEIPLSADERIEKMIAGMPGQKQRILHVVRISDTPKTLDEIVAELDEAFPTSVSVYDSAQIVKLLEKAGALDAREIEAKNEFEAAGAEEEPEGEYLEVASSPVYEYTATEAGRKALEDHLGDRPLVELLSEEPRYLPLYRKILEMCAVEGGCPTKELDAAIDHDPLCEEPKRFCTYFVDRLEEVGALKWQSTWMATESGTKILETDLFTNEERS